MKIQAQPTITIDHYVENHATAFGAADASVLANNRDQSVDEKFATGQQQQQQQLHYQKPKILTPKNRIKIATWDVCIGYQVSNREVIVSELLRYGISIAALTELRLTESGSMLVQALNNDDYMILYYFGGPNHIAGATWRSIKQYPRASSPSNQSQAVWLCYHFQGQSRHTSLLLTHQPKLVPTKQKTSSIHSSRSSWIHYPERTWL